MKMVQPIGLKNFNIINNFYIQLTMGDVNKMNSMEKHYNKRAKQDQKY